MGQRNNKEHLEFSFFTHFRFYSFLRECGVMSGAISFQIFTSDYSRAKCRNPYAAASQEGEKGSQYIGVGGG